MRVLTIVVFLFGVLAICGFFAQSRLVARQYDEIQGLRSNLVEAREKSEKLIARASGFRQHDSDLHWRLSVLQDALSAHQVEVKFAPLAEPEILPERDCPEDNEVSPASLVRHSFHRIILPRGR